MSKPARHRLNHQNRRYIRIRLIHEQLEVRQLLAADLQMDNDQPAEAWSSSSEIRLSDAFKAKGINWFEQIASMERVPLSELDNVDRILPEGIAGPNEPASGEWLVQLTDAATTSLRSLSQARTLLNGSQIEFTIISGLGKPGLVLVGGKGSSRASIEMELRNNPNVKHFSLNQLLEGQATSPDDPEFVGGLMPGLEKVEAINAWDVTRGSLSTVVGVVDGGVDPTHPDLYLNIWLNQGELPTKYLDNTGPRLTDIDNDGLISFYDLNNVTRAATTPYSITVRGFATGPNASFVVDRNNNGRIDTIDLLEDPNWADGFDTDDNGFFDDFFGVNFRSGTGDPFASNNPSDELGHGTHVAGTIGAIGGNREGVVGVNWQTSLMSLRILDNNNQGDSGAAIRAINYAREMRERYRVESNGRVTEGANVRVLNNSWGQPGGFEVSLEAAIQDSSDAGILFVAAAGNGNFLGQGVDNDRTPFYPARYDVPGVIAVAASDLSDRPASFSNYGVRSVDVFAPGVGIRSTLPSGGYGSANGTSMATPHVSGTAALVWSAFPEATVAEVQKAILTTVDPIANGNLYVSTAGRLNTAKSVNADVFAPSARVVAKQDITTAGGISTEFTIEYSHRSGININTLGNDDLAVTRQWGPADQFIATLKPNSVSSTSRTATATYIVTAPGGTWDALDFGDYVISTVAGRVQAAAGNKTTEARDIGRFNVKVIDPAVLYVTNSADSLEPGTLRSQIMIANAVAPAPRTILLEAGVYNVGIPAVVDLNSTFPTPSSLSQCAVPALHSGWSNQTTGDFDITGVVTIIGSGMDSTSLDGSSFDRVMKVHPGAKLTLSHVAIVGGVSPADQGGGGVLSAGEFTLNNSIVRGNRALGNQTNTPIGGGGVAVWAGRTNVSRSWIDDNESNFGGGIFYCDASEGAISQSTISNNRGGGIQGSSGKDLHVTNSTISANVGGNGAIADYNGANNASRDPSISADGRYIAFSSKADNLVPGDTNGLEDIFVKDRITGAVELVSIANDGSQAINFSYQPLISGDGRFVAFGSYSENFVPGDTSDGEDVYVFDRLNRTIQCATLSLDGRKAGGYATSISGDGRYVTFTSFADNLVAGDTNNLRDTFIYDTALQTTDRVSGSGGAELERSINGLITADGNTVIFYGNLAPSSPHDSEFFYAFDRLRRTIERVTPTDRFLYNIGKFAISGDGQVITFSSSSSLVPEDTNSRQDVYVYNRLDQSLNLVSIRTDGAGNGSSELPTISSDGRFVAFSSDSSNLVLGDTNGKTDVFVFDRNQRTLARVYDSQGGIGRVDFGGLSLSADGRYGVFSNGYAGPLLDNLENPQNAYVLDRMSDQVRSVSFDQDFSTIRGTGLTIAGSTLSPYSVSGSVVLQDSILVNTNAAVGSRVAFDNSLQDASPGVSLLGPLTRLGMAPPVHLLLRGNPAIDSGGMAFSGSVDQLGNLRVKPDIGAMEAINAFVLGSVYVDENRNQVFDEGEPAVANSQVIVQSISGADSTWTNDSGVYEFEGLLPGRLSVSTVLPENFSPSLPLTQRIPPSFVPNNSSFGGMLSANGRFVAFTSDATNLVSPDTNGLRDQFLYDRALKSTVLVDGRVSSIGPDGSLVLYRDSWTNTNLYLLDPNSGVNRLIGTGFNARFSENGRYIFFESGDYFIYDRETSLTRQITIRGSSGELPNGSFSNASISEDGASIVFESNANNLVQGDLNSRWNVFRYDLDSNSISRVSTHAIANLTDFFSLSISADNRFAVFVSSATDLVPVDTNQANDVFLFDRLNGSIELVSKLTSGLQANDFSNTPSISADGRFISYGSEASNLVSNDTNLNRDIFVFDRISKTTVRVNETEGSQQQRGFSFAQTISADGSLVVYEYFPNTNDADRDGPSEVFVAANPLVKADRSRTVFAGDLITDLNFGLVPNLGTISGRVFEDSVFNSTYDAGEPPIANALVFLDLDGDRTLDNGERSVRTTADGSYQFDNTRTFQSHSIVIQMPVGFEQISPSASEQFAWSIFLPAGGTVSERDFAIRRVQSTGQSSDSAVSGRLYDDRNGNKMYDAGDVPIANREVYLDATNFGIRDVNEPVAETNAEGLYSIRGLSSRTVAVTTTLDSTLIHVSPLGSNFSLQKFPLYSSFRPFTNPQAIASGDFNQDGFLDVAMALGEANKLGIRLNNGLGGFLATEIDVDLGSNGTGPTSLVVGQFDGDSKLDVALTANYSSKVIVLLNFNSTTRTFASQSAVTVGLLPIDLVAGQFGGDSKMDLAIVNQGSTSVASTVQLLINNGSGLFTPGSAVPTGGKTSVSIVAGNFSGDTATDIAIVHSNPSTTSTPNGGVTVLRGNGSGGLTLEASYYQVGALPIDSVTADFNGDGRADMAVANFNSNSISILLGQANGTFRVQTAILGTASGAFDITVGDIDNDNDIDVIASNLKDRNISIFRNIGANLTTGDVQFEPLENVGLALTELARRMPLVVGNFNNDRSGPDGTGTLDIVAIPQQSDTLHVLNNRLVNGSRRVALTGKNSFSGLDFIIKPSILAPTFAPIDNPAAVVEDAAEQVIGITGIRKGRASGPALRFSSTSNLPTLIDKSDVTFVDGSSSADLKFSFVANAHGTAIITVRAVDAGADASFDTFDDGILERSFTVTVLPVNDAPTFSLPASRNVTALEDSGERTITGFITNVTAGGGTYETTQSLTSFSVEADNLGLFNVRPMIDATGTLRFTPAANAVGTVTVTITMSDNGDTAFGGSNRKVDQFVLTVNPINDAPSINIGGKQTVLVGAAAQSVSGFATGFATGGGTDENTQAIAGFVITVDKPDLFSVLPMIDSAGTLRFTPSTSRTGLARVSVQVRDTGGSSNGGVDLSTLKTFDIEVAPLPDTVAPMPVFSSLSPAITNVSPIDLTVDFGEVVTGFALSDLVLTNATAANLTDLGAGKFTIAVSPTADGVVTVSIPAAAARDLASNNNLASASFTRTVDRVAPVATITTTEVSPTNRLSFPIVISFGEAVTGFDANDLVVGNSTVTNLTETTPGRYTATVNANADGIVLVGFSAGIARDAAGNGNTAPTPLLVSVNTGAATYKPLLSTTEAAITPNRNFPATIDFGRVVTGFVAADLELTNATATISDLGNGRFQVNLSVIGDGNVIVRLPADRVRDANNRPNDSSDTLTVRFVDTVNSDFGDAPTSAQSGFAGSYPTRLVDNGAFHRRSTLFLGAISDAEPDGQPNASATGDDATGGDDENGILFPFSNVIGLSAATTSSFVATASANGFLDAWIDFNRDGDWSDSGEQVATRLALVVGSNSVSFTIPANASAGTSYARFRISTAGGLAVTGPAVDGEVEDHAVTFVSGASKSVSFKAADLGPHEILINNGLLVVKSGSSTLWSAPATEIAKFTTLSATDAKLFEVSAPGSNLPGTVRYTGSGQPIELISNQPAIDLASLSADKLYGIGVIDLRTTGVHQLTVRRLDVSAINATKSLRILMDSADTLVALSSWTSGTGRMENGAWLQPYTSVDATIEIVSATPWQNEVNPFDVDGDNGISPLDVLDLINVINLNVFPNGNLPSRGSSTSKSFFDTNGDGRADPLDVLKVINELNRSGASEGEGEGSVKVIQAESPMSRTMIDRAMAADLDSMLGDIESERVGRRQARIRQLSR